jgi:hypothetical protein
MASSSNTVEVPAMESVTEPPVYNIFFPSKFSLMFGIFFKQTCSYLHVLCILLCRYSFQDFQGFGNKDFEETYQQLVRQTYLHPCVSVICRLFFFLCGVIFFLILGVC